MESTKLTLEELELIIFVMSKTPQENRSSKFTKVYSKALLLIVEELEKTQQKTTL
jgi:hypothetical protein